MGIKFITLKILIIVVLNEVKCLQEICITQIGVKISRRMSEKYVSIY